MIASALALGLAVPAPPATDDRHQAEIAAADQMFVASLAGGSIVSVQTLSAIVTHNGVGPLVTLGDARRFETGANVIGDNAFATFAGVLTLSWNTGLNANAQAATNIAWSGSFSALNSVPSAPSIGR